MSTSKDNIFQKQEEFVQKKDNIVHKKGNIGMWLENLREARTKTNKSVKQIAEETGVTEKTLTRIFSGNAKMPRFETLALIASACDTSLEEIFAESCARLASGDLIALQEKVDQLTSELSIITAELSVSNGKVASLTAENDMLRLKLEHKDEIISLHNYYNSVRSGTPGL